MRNLKGNENEISACADLTLIQRIPAEQLEVLEQTYSIMLESIREVLAVRRERDKRMEQASMQVVQAVPPIYAWYLSRQFICR